MTCEVEAGGAVSSHQGVNLPHADTEMPETGASDEPWIDFACEHEIDLQAMKAGAADYLVKGRLDAGLLERSIRYAIERKRAATIAAAEQARLAAFGAQIGLALTRPDPLDTILQRCATAMVRFLNAGLAQIWVNPQPSAANAQLCIELGASAGPINDSTPLASKTPNVSINLAVSLVMNAYNRRIALVTR